MEKCRFVLADSTAAKLSPKPATLAREAWRAVHHCAPEGLTIVLRKFVVENEGVSFDWVCLHWGGRGSLSQYQVEDLRHKGVLVEA